MKWENMKKQLTRNSWTELKSSSELTVLLKSTCFHNGKRGIYESKVYIVNCKVTDEEVAQFWDVKIESD
jgi:hypothetical protein